MNIWLNFVVLFTIFVVLTNKSYSATIFDPNKCDQGCKTAEDCPTNAHCVAVTQTSDCGLCLCEAGYKTEGSKCVPNSKNKSSNSKKTGKENGGGAGGNSQSVTDSTRQTTTEEKSTTQSQQETSTSASLSTTTGSTTSSGPTTQGPPPAPTPLNCADFACSTQIQSSDSDNPFTVRAQLFNESSDCKRKLVIPGRACKLNGGGACYGAYCLTVDSGNDYCICPPYRVDRQCAVEKPGKCESATGQVSSAAYKVQNKRYRNKNSPDNGSIYGRHFAASMDDCIKLCQWTNGSCRSVNYGTIAGSKVCELLSANVTKGSLLDAWLVDAQGWVHQQVI